MKDMKGGEKREREGGEQEKRSRKRREVEGRKIEKGRMEKEGKLKEEVGRERGEKEGRQGKRSFHLSAQILSHIHHTCAKCQTPHKKKCHGYIECPSSLVQRA